MCMALAHPIIPVVRVFITYSTTSNSPKGDNDGYSGNSGKYGNYCTTSNSSKGGNDGNSGNLGEPERAPNLAILLGPHVCIMFVLWYARLTKSRYNILFLRITYYVLRSMQGTWRKWLL